MQRRAFLTSVGGLAALTGCLSDEGTEAGDGSPTGRATPTGTPPGGETARPPPSATPTPGPELTRTPTDPDGSPTASPGDSEPSTPTPTEREGDDVPTATGEPSQPGDIDSAWPLPASDAGGTNRTAAAGPTNPVAGLWSVAVGSGLSEPVLADGTVYVGARDGTVLALDGRDGSERWRRSVGDLAVVPSVVGDRLVVPTGTGLVALAASDGRELWRVETPDRADAVGPDGVLHSVPVFVYEGGVFTVSGADPPAVVRRSLADGSVEWRTEIAEPWDLPLFAGDADALFLSSGYYDSRFWRLDVETGDPRNEPPRSGADFPSVAFSDWNAYYTVESFFGSVEMVPLDGSSGWSTGVPPGGEGGDLTDGGDRVYYTTTAENSRVIALSKADGATDWEAETPGEIVGRPVAAGDVVVVPATAGLYGLDPTDGSDRWLRPGDATGEHAVVADDLVFSTREGAVRAFCAP